jgi:glutamate--cysteine ligase catalytic subunit
MGLLTQGVPLEWSEVRQYVDIIKTRGIKGFLQIHKQYKDHKHDFLKWGDEVEFNLVHFDHENKKVQLLLKSNTILPVLQEAQKHNDLSVKTHWCPEFADYMVEGTPAKPYGDEISDFTRLEGNMHLRRRQIQDLLSNDEYAFSLSVFPLLGCEDFTYPSYKPTPNKGITRSLFYPDQAIFMVHPRYSTIAKNIRDRRNSNLVVNVPIFVDEQTPQPFNEDLSKYSGGKKITAQKENHIYLDSIGFGMGCSCLQTTFQAQSIDEARHLYDQLTPLTPIMLALSAASPIWRGYLSETDVRWGIISGSVDDRTPEERGEKPLKENTYRISKSRYDTVDSYLSPEGSRYNDIEVVINKEAYQMMVENGIDDQLARHIAHLFIRDPVCLFKEKLVESEHNNIDCFENIQSTNWQSMRFKPPPEDSPIGWRVEFRPIDLQLTDFENAAFVTFLVLFTRVVLSFKLNLLVPISKVDENMKKGQKRDACRKEKFYFRKNIFHSTHLSAAEYKSKHHRVGKVGGESGEEEDDCALMSIDDIINGNDEFVGLIPLIEEYLDNLIIDYDTMDKIKGYLKFISARASGQLLTAASFMRKFVNEHPKYNHDSIVTDEIAYDLLWRIQLISSGEIKCPEMFFERLFKDRLV